MSQSNIDAITAKTEKFLDDTASIIESVFPATMKGSFARFYQIARDIVLRDPKLEKCSAGSKVVAVHTCAKLGLIPDPALGHIDIIPRAGRAVAQIGYKGIIVLALRSPLVRSMRASTVYKNDDFFYEGGGQETLKHIPWYLCGKDESGEIVAGYSVAEMADGGPPGIKVIGPVELDAAKKSAHISSDSPWNKHEAAMVAKTAVRRHAPFLPQSTELQHYVGTQDAIEAGEPIPIPQEIMDVIDKNGEAKKPQGVDMNWLNMKRDQYGLLPIEAIQLCEIEFGEDAEIDKLTHEQAQRLVAKFKEASEETATNDIESAGAVEQPAEQAAIPLSDDG